LQPLPAVPATPHPSPPTRAEVTETAVPDRIAAERVSGSLGHPEFYGRP